jgi:uncharacterized protein (DUF1810 family)
MTLGPSPEECVRLVLACEARTAKRVFGFPDYLTFRFCLTLVAVAAPDLAVFA